MAKVYKYVIAINNCSMVVDSVTQDQEVLATYVYNDDFDFGSIRVDDLIAEMYEESRTKYYSIEQVI
jgi:hypothetical protein